MIKPDELERIESYNNSNFPILSVYLGADNLQAPSEKFLITQFHSLLHQSLDKEQREIFQTDIERIEDFLNDYIPTSRSLIIFSSGERLWEVVNLEFYLEANISINMLPNLDPILKSEQKYSKYMVLLVDREKARMFTVEQGEIAEQSEFSSNYVPQNKQATGRDGNAGRSDIMTRHTNELLKRHIDNACKAASKFASTKDIDFLIIGGHSEIFAKVAKSLPLNLRDKLAGSFVTEINIPLNDILIKSKEIAEVVN